MLCCCWRNKKDAMAAGEWNRCEPHCTYLPNGILLWTSRKISRKINKWTNAYQNSFSLQCNYFQFSSWKVSYVTPNLDIKNCFRGSNELFSMAKLLQSIWYLRFGAIQKLKFTYRHLRQIDINAQVRRPLVSSSVDILLWVVILFTSLKVFSTSNAKYRGLKLWYISTRPTHNP